MDSRGATIPEEDDSEGEDDDQRMSKSQLSERRPGTKGRDFATGEGMEHPDENPRSSQDLSNRRASIAFNDFGDDALQALYDEGITLKKRIVNLYTSVCELRSFIQLNETGFGKVLKKYDKTIDRKLKSSYLAKSVKPAYPFQQSTMDHVNENLQKVEHAYAAIVTKGDVDLARQELRLHLREHVVWERNTVWREMIGIERKAQAANLGIRNTMLGQDNDPKKARLQGDSEDGSTKEVSTPLGRKRCPKFLLSSTFWVLMLDIAVFAVLLTVPIMDKPEQQNCLALVIFVSLLWATEVRWVLDSIVCKSLTASAGNPSVRHIPLGPATGRPPSSRSPGRATSQSTHCSRCCNLRVRRHVDACHHAAAWWLHHRCGVVKV